MRSTDLNYGGRSVARNLTFLLIGGGIGAGLAFLFAPKSGAELRGDIAETARTGYDGAVDLAQRVKDESANLYRSVIDKGDNLLTLASDAIDDTKARVSQAVEAGKDKVSEVRSSADKLIDEASSSMDDVRNRKESNGRRASSVI